jgi:hypothetical protein
MNNGILLIGSISLFAIACFIYMFTTIDVNDTKEIQKTQKAQEIIKYEDIDTLRTISVYVLDDIIHLKGNRVFTQSGRYNYEFVSREQAILFFEDASVIYIEETYKTLDSYEDQLNQMINVINNSDKKSQILNLLYEEPI